MDLYATYRRAIAGRRLPLAYCDLDRLDENVEALATRAMGNPIRVASKSVRCWAILERVLRHPAYEGLMSYSPAEAAFLADKGVDDVFVAYPSVDAHDVGLVLDRVAQGRRIALMVDDESQVRALDRLARERDVVLPLALDIDMSSSFPGIHFGVRRSPIRDVEAARRVGRVIARRTHVRLEGIMGYEAQLAGLPDGTARAAYNVVVRALKSRSAAEVIDRRVAIVEALRADGHPIRFVNGGGTGSLELTATDPSVTESTAGSGLFSPALFDEFAGFRHLPAAGFAVPVVRRPAPGFVTCHGGGYVASGSAGPDKLPKPFLPEGLSLVEQEGAGEVQTPLRYRGAPPVGIGDPVFFRHAKAGELCERFATMLLLEGGEVVDEVPTYRGEGQCFL